MRSILSKTALLAGLSLIFLAACASSPADDPDVTFDGLVKVSDTKFAKVYKKPGADLAGYAKYGIVPCQVAFKKNWMRDQNRNRIDLSNRVTQKDVDRIKGELSKDCDEKFRAALLEKPAYALVEEFNEGEAVLVLRPAIINLDVSAPDVMSTGMSRSYTTSSGEMTLLLELVDGTTGEVLARVADRERDIGGSRLQWSNSVTNRAEADRALRRWAKTLREGLDTVSERK